MSTALDILLVLLLAIGCFFTFLGSFSLVKLSSFFLRIHGPTKASALGVGCILIVSIVYHTFYGAGLHPREVLITVFVFLTAPVSAILMSQSALSLMDNTPIDPSHTPDPEAPIREDIDNRNTRRGDEPQDAADTTTSGPQPPRAS
ncbi:cation:proton antiporter [Luteimonas abyssi]|uniref:cation:proton antiporter n=1 Tax=Luteimonas abyssi TaxID=1247514 RepID=UPI0009EBF928|nr:monovalent cation/H(+) antiporter subunit G [Luteimonas abyssi]